MVQPHTPRATAKKGYYDSNLSEFFVSEKLNLRQKQSIQYIQSNIAWLNRFYIGILLRILLS